MLFEKNYWQPNKLIIVLCLIFLSFKIFGQNTLRETLVEPANDHPLIVVSEKSSEVNTIDSSNHLPLTIPLWKPPKNNQITNDRLMGYNLKDKTEFFAEKTEPNLIIGNSISQDWISPHAPVDSQLINNSTDIPGLTNFGNLSLVSDPSVYPYCTVVKLFIKFPSIDGVVPATGVLIDAKHVLTAGHCIYNDSLNEWATSIRVVPAWHYCISPFGEAQATILYSWSGWVINKDFNWDMGYILIDRPVGGVTGWLGYGYNDDNSFFSNRTFISSGYPFEPPYDGLLMYAWGGTFDEIGTNTLYLKPKIGIGGQSGSGAYTLINGSRYVFAVHSHGIFDPSTGGWKTGFCRINSVRFNSISNQIALNTPSSFDFIPLNVRSSPLSLPAGSQLTSFDHVLLNYSKASWSGTVATRIYLSTDQNITSSDVLLQTRSFTGPIVAKGSLRLVALSSLPTIPVTTKPGVYYIGVIVDITDANTSNNVTGIWDVSKVNISAPPPVTPSPVWPANGATNIVLNPSLRWTSCSGTIFYGLEVSTNSNFSSFVYANSRITTNMQQVLGLVYNKLYFWRVRAGNDAGTSEYSSIYSFTTIGPTSVEEYGNSLPSSYNLFQNYPNPFNPDTRIQFDIPKQSMVILSIFDIKGAEIEIILNQTLPPGHYKIEWAPRGIMSGVYYYRLQANEFTETKKLIFLK